MQRLQAVLLIYFVITVCAVALLPDELQLQRGLSLIVTTLSCSSFKRDCQELPNPCSATISVATDTQFKSVTA